MMSIKSFLFSGVLLISFALSFWSNRLNLICSFFLDFLPCILFHFNVRILIVPFKRFVLWFSVQFRHNVHFSTCSHSASNQTNLDSPLGYLSTIRRRKESSLAKAVSTICCGTVARGEHRMWTTVFVQLLGFLFLIFWILLTQYFHYYCDRFKVVMPLQKSLSLLILVKPGHSCQELLC